MTRRTAIDKASCKRQRERETELERDREHVRESEEKVARCELAQRHLNEAHGASHDATN